MSTPRLRRLAPVELTDTQRKLHATITGGPRARGPQSFALTDAEGRLHGPFNAMLLSPELGRALQELGAAIRYASQLPARTREMAILVVAASWDSAFERHAHERVGAAVGLTEPELLALREGADPGFTDPLEHAAWELTRTLVDAGGTLTDEEYERARGALDERTLFELSTLVGYYGTLALQLRLFAVPAPPGPPNPSPSPAPAD
ncbi:carboxymuconolactone decarboxylase family protein [Streptomyces geranii]|uniref:carboxymuconolactone decarboxylase family protein n=1 Tax=Streptomyces geranii TaxID=2058923 RepID=UPI000D034B9C|nr:carboxymuconolactone decarboxylase family protein [Streptomyces geranii]